MHINRLAQAIADTVTVLGIRQQPDEVAYEIESLTAEPLGWFLKHPNWPSGLTADGCPFEFSVAISGNGSPAIRYGVDVTDHREGMAGNWARYLDWGERLTGVPRHPPSQLWELFTRHLDGIKATARTRMLHGAGYGPSGFRRATLYFLTRWLSHSELEQRFPEHASMLGGMLGRCGGRQPVTVQMMSYDFVDGDLTRTKLYLRLGSNGEPKRFSDIAGEHPDLDAAAQVYTHFRAQHSAAQLASSLLLQLSYGRETTEAREKLAFMCPAWGWHRPEGLLDLVVYLADTFSMDLSSLYAMFGVFAEYRILLTPTIVALGPGGQPPAASFYFAPSLERVPFTIPAWQRASAPEANERETASRRVTASGDAPKSRLELVEGLLDRATDYVLRAQAPEGYWIDLALPAGPSDEWVTAYIVAALAQEATLHDQLQSSIGWLQKRFRAGEGWGYNANSGADADATALGLVAMRRMGADLLEGAGDALLRHRLPGGGYSAYVNNDRDHEHGFGAPEITAIVLLAQLETGLGEAAAIGAAVANLLSQQREEGGWNAFWWKDDLVATQRVVHALNVFVRWATVGMEINPVPDDLVESAAKAVRDARPSVSAQAIPDEPFLLGLWLSTWFAAGGHVSYPSVDRIVDHLASQQEEDGRWLAAPIRRTARTKLRRPWARSDSGRLYLDPRCLVTTCTVAVGLRALRQAVLAEKRHVQGSTGPS